MYGFNSSTKFKAEQEALDLLKILKIDIPKDLMIILSELGINYQEVSLSDGIAGAMLVSDDNYGILINSNIEYEGKKRFTIAHELGHYLLHGNQGTVDCFTTDIGSFNLKKNQKEFEADTFAAEFLMPTPIFTKEVKRKEPSISLFKELADKYEVSLTAASIKFVKLNETPAMLIYLENGKVIWNIKSVGINWDIVPNPEDCLIHKIIAKSEARIKGRTFSGDWISNYKYDYISEDSINFVKLGSQLVLLTVPDEYIDEELDDYE